MMRDAIRQLPVSRIREVANAGLGRSDVLAFWFGEGDEPTPAVIRDAAVESLARGETFYGHNLGLPELREAVAGYMSALHGPIGPGRIAVTSAGVSGLMIAMQALAGAGDEVAVVVPVWPNLVAQPAILGAKVKRIALQPTEGAWRLDLDALRASVTSRTRVLLVNSPGNPTGWTLSREEHAAILAHCRGTGTWIVADEVYERLYYDCGPSESGAGEPGSAAAPSFLDVAGPEDRLVVAHSFSKSFLMTGWRLGWLVMPERLLDTVGKLIEFNTSCAPVFIQRAGLAALSGAATLVPGVVSHLRSCRDTLLPALQSLPGIEVAVPRGGMYAFMRLPGADDSLATAKRLVVDFGLGLAPGVAFGQEAEGWLRWCFASRDPGRLTQGVERLRQALPL